MAYVNFTVASDLVQVIKDLIDAGDFKAVTETTKAVVCHAPYDPPQNEFTLQIDDITGVWEGSMVAARVTAGISGASFNGNEIFLYSTDGDAETFSRKVKLSTTK